MDTLQNSDNGIQKGSSRKTLFVIIALVLVFAALILKTTLAANITVNSGTIEFGQGVSAVTACDNAVVMTPTATFDYNSNQFNFEKILIAHDGASPEAIATSCNSKTLTVKLYKTDGTVITGGQFEFKLDSTATRGIVQTGTTGINLDTSNVDTEAGIYIFPSSTTIDSSLITKITIESN